MNHGAASKNDNTLGCISSSFQTSFGLRKILQMSKFGMERRQKTNRPQQISLATSLDDFTRSLYLFPGLYFAPWKPRECGNDEVNSLQY